MKKFLKVFISLSLIIMLFQSTYAYYGLNRTEPFQTPPTMPTSVNNLVTTVIRYSQILGIALAALLFVILLCIFIKTKKKGFLIAGIISAILIAGAPFIALMVWSSVSV